MNHNRNVESFKEYLVKDRTVLNGSLVVFEQQEFVSHIQQEE